MLQIEIEGTIIKALELRTGTSARTGNEWKRQDYVLETPGQYPRKCTFTIANDDIDRFNLKEGASVKVTISIDAHEYDGRWFNDFRAVNVEQPTATVPPTGAQIGVAAPQPAAPASAGDPLLNPNQKLSWE